jgi:hypothetical protein
MNKRAFPDTGFDQPEEQKGKYDDIIDQAAQVCILNSNQSHQLPRKESKK